MDVNESLFITPVSINVIKVSAWISDEGVLWRIRLEGALTSDDSVNAVRTFDISN